MISFFFFLIIGTGEIPETKIRMPKWYHRVVWDMRPHDSEEYAMSIRRRTAFRSRRILEQ